MRVVCVVINVVALILFAAALSAEPIIVSGGPENDYESWLARLNDGRLMVVFDRNPDWQSGDLYATYSSDNGQTWASPEPIIVESGDQATLSFAQLPGDTVRLWYASNEDGAYKIYSAHSPDSENWVEEGPLDLGWGQYENYYDPTVIMEEDSSLTMSYIVSGQGAYIAHCPYGDAWDTMRTRVAEGGYRARVMKHADGTYLFAYHRRTGGQYEYDVFVRTSTDRLRWSSPVQLTSNHNSHDPFPNMTEDGAYMVYYAKYQNPAYNLCRRLSYDGINWTDEEQITFDATNNTQPHFFAEDGLLYLIWAHAVSYPYDHDVYFETFPIQTDIDGEISENDPISRLNIDSYPNPFNTSTVIRYALPRQSNVRFEIYNILGQKVDVLFDGYKQAGCHMAIWRADDFPSGVYFARLEAGDDFESIKITFLK
jgi:hypothetical protein